MIHIMKDFTVEQNKEGVFLEIWKIARIIACKNRPAQYI